MLILVCSNPVNLQPPKIELLKEDLVDFAMPCIWRCAIRDCRKSKTDEIIIPRNKKLREFYDKKRDEGKPFKVAVIACVNKLLHWIFALLKSKSTFQDIA